MEYLKKKKKERNVSSPPSTSHSMKVNPILNIFNM